MPTAKFHIPDFLNGMEAVHFLIWAKKYAPEIFYPNTEIESVFGTFDDCIWNGGTMFLGGSTSWSDMKDIIEHYNFELNLPITFTFTNPVITKECHCEDTYCNLMAELGNNGYNRILVTSPVLEEYLRKHYKNYLYCRSIIASEDMPYDLSKYYISVLKRAKNNDWDYLNSVPEEDRGSIEILCNDPCPDHCPKIYSHYTALGKHQLSREDRNHSEIDCLFSNDPVVRYDMKHKSKTYVSRKMIDEFYLPAGYQHFKMSGRHNPSRIMAGILDYMIKPDYHEDALTGMYQTFSINYGTQIYRWKTGYYDRVSLN